MQTSFLSFHHHKFDTHKKFANVSKLKNTYFEHFEQNDLGQLMCDKTNPLNNTLNFDLNKKVNSE